LWPTNGPLGPSAFPDQIDSGGECGVPTAMHFLQPSPTLFSPYYSFRRGPIFVVIFSAEFDFSTGSIQWLFVRDELATVNKTETPFVIVATHRPFYGNIINSTSPQGSVHVAEMLRQYIEPLFLNSKGENIVDLVVAGHFHEYQRSCAVLNGTCLSNAINGTMPKEYIYKQVNAPVHIMIGVAGADISCCHAPVTPIWTEFTTPTFGYARVYVNKTVLTWDFIRAIDGQLEERVLIIKE
jgi:acid phosphatase type 7